MLTIARKSRSPNSQDEEANGHFILPAGQQYLTKVNGKLVMARNKRPKVVTTDSVDLLGAAFGVRTQTIRKRSSSESAVRQPFLADSVPVVTKQLPKPSYSAPLLQNGFTPFPNGPAPGKTAPQPLMLGQSPQYLSYQQWVPVNPSVPNHPLPAQPRPGNYRAQTTLKEFEQMIEATINEKVKVQVAAALGGDKDESAAPRADNSIPTHVCANCNRIRSKKYHREHPLKPGECPVPDYCRKCQRESSSTSSTERTKDTRKSKTGNQEKEEVHNVHKDTEKTAQTEAELPTTGCKPHEGKMSSSSGTHMNFVKENVSREDITKSRKKHSAYVADEDSPQRTPQPRQEAKFYNDFSEISRQPRTSVVGKTGHVRAHSIQVDGSYNVPVKTYYSPEKSHETNRTSRYGHSTTSVESSIQLVAPRNEEDVKALPRRRRTRRQEAVSSFSYGPTSPHELNASPAKPNTPGWGESFGSDNSQRRRRERLYSDEGFARKSFDYLQSAAKDAPRPSSEVTQPWDLPHVINPRPGQTVVVTETFVYRPKEQIYTQTEEDHSIKRMPADEGHKYYQNDWSNTNSFQNQDEPPRGRSVQRRGDPNKPVSESEEINTQYARAYEHAHENISHGPLRPRPKSNKTLSATKPSTSLPAYTTDVEYEAKRRSSELREAAQPAGWGNPLITNTASNHNPPLDHISPIRDPYTHNTGSSYTLSSISTTRPGSVHTVPSTGSYDICDSAQSEVVTEKDPFYDYTFTNSLTSARDENGVPRVHYRPSSQRKKGVEPQPAVNKENDPLYTYTFSFDESSALISDSQQGIHYGPTSSHEKISPLLRARKTNSAQEKSAAVDRHARPQVQYGPSFKRKSEGETGGSFHSQALVPSPAPDKQGPVFWDDEFEVSDITETEEMAEEATRHVRFQDEVVSASEVTGWNDEGKGK